MCTLCCCHNNQNKVHGVILIRLLTYSKRWLKVKSFQKRSVDFIVVFPLTASPLFEMIFYSRKNTICISVKLIPGFGGREGRICCFRGTGPEKLSTVLYTFNDSANRCEPGTRLNPIRLGFFEGIPRNAKVYTKPLSRAVHPGRPSSFSPPWQ